MSELNTTAALSTAALSSAVGFGLAFYIAAKINKGMLSKSQKVWVYVAMTSFGLGLTGVLNEFIGFPLQGLSIRGDKVVQYIFGNILILPPIFLGIAYLLRSRSRKISAHSEVATEQQSTQQSQTPTRSTTATPTLKKKTIGIAIGTLVAIGIVVKILEVNTPPVFEARRFEKETDSAGNEICKNSLEKDYAWLVSFKIKPNTTEVLLIRKDENNDKRNILLENCRIFDQKNWKCGGDSKPYGNRLIRVDSTYELVDGNRLEYTPREMRDSRTFERILSGRQDCGMELKKAGLITALMF